MRNQLANEFLSTVGTAATRETRALAEKAKREQRIRIAEEKEAPLRAACDESGFNAILEALEALPEDDEGKKFTVCRRDASYARSLGFERGPFDFEISYLPKDANEKVGKRAIIEFELEKKNKITCTRHDRLMRNYSSVSYGPPGGNNLVYEERKFRNMKKAAKELVKWVDSVAPNRSGDLKQQMVTQAEASAQNRISTPAASLRKKLMSKLPGHH